MSKMKIIEIAKRGGLTELVIALTVLGVIILAVYVFLSIIAV